MISLERGIKEDKRQKIYNINNLRAQKVLEHPSLQN
jgi:hypothetical protein